MWLGNESTKQETIELRKVKPESDVAFQCGRNTLERKTINREQNACMHALRIPRKKEA